MQEHVSGQILSLFLGSELDARRKKTLLARKGKQKKEKEKEGIKVKKEHIMASIVYVVCVCGVRVVVVVVTEGSTKEGM